MCWCKVFFTHAESRRMLAPISTMVRDEQWCNHFITSLFFINNNDEWPEAGEWQVYRMRGGAYHCRRGGAYWDTWWSEPPFHWTPRTWSKQDTWSLKDTDREHELCQSNCIQEPIRKQTLALLGLYTGFNVPLKKKKRTPFCTSAEAWLSIWLKISGVEPWIGPPVYHAAPCTNTFTHSFTTRGGS